MRPHSLMIAACLAVLAAASLAVSVIEYVGAPHAVSSTSGEVVLRNNGELVAYPPFELGIEATLIGIAIVLVAAAVFVGAVQWRGRGPA